MKSCSHCKKFLDDTQFVKGDGKVMKTCSLCRERSKLNIERNKCIHSRQKRNCPDCMGSNICPHRIQKQQCKKCSDAKQVTIKMMIQNSKRTDIRLGFYDANNFIDKCYIEMLMDESMECPYCDVPMIVTEYSLNLVTVERIDNSVGHIKSNCMLCCLSCNLGKVGQ